MKPIRGIWIPLDFAPRGKSSTGLWNTKGQRLTRRKNVPGTFYTSLFIHRWESILVGSDGDLCLIRRCEVKEATDKTEANVLFDLEHETIKNSTGRHVSYVWSLAKTENEEIFFSGGYGGKVCVWRCENNPSPTEWPTCSWKYLNARLGLIGCLKPIQSTNVLCVGTAVSLISVKADGEKERPGPIDFLDYSKDVTLKRMSHEDGIYGLDYDPEKNVVLTASFDKTARIIDFRTFKEVQTFEHDGGLCGCFFREYHEHEFVVGERVKPHQIYVRDMRKSTEEISKFVAHNSFIYRVFEAMSNEKEYIVTSSNEHRVKIFNGQTFKLEKEIPTTATAYGACFCGERGGKRTTKQMKMMMEDLRTRLDYLFFMIGENIQVVKWTTPKQIQIVVKYFSWLAT